MRKFSSLLSRRALFAGTAAAILIAAPASAQNTIKVGLVAAMSGQSAKSGEAITRGLSLAIDEINAKGGVLGKKIELVSRDDESNPAKGVVAARELVQREGVVAFFGGVDTPVSLAIVPFANQAKVPFMGVWAAGTPHHQERRARKLRLPRLGRRRDRRYRARRLRREEIRRQEARHDPDQQFLGRVERERPQGRARRKEDSLCRHREIRDQRRRCRAAAHPPEGSGRRRTVPRRQCRALRAGGEVARPHGLGRADRLALGAGRRPLLGARGRKRSEGSLHPDLFLLRQALAQGRSGARRAEEEISRDQVDGRRDPGSRYRQRL